MTVAVSLNLSEGVILGADSARACSPLGVVWLRSTRMPTRSSNWRPPVGHSTYGLGGLGGRTVGSYLREFEVTKSDSCSKFSLILSKICGLLSRTYMSEVAPTLEQQHGKPFDQLQADQIVSLGLIVGGFSPNALPLRGLEHRSADEQGSRQCPRGER